MRREQDIRELSFNREPKDANNELHSELEEKQIKFKNSLAKAKQKIRNEFSHTFREEEKKLIVELDEEERRLSF